MKFSPSYQRLIVHIDADAFFAAVEQGFNPLLRNRPVIVGGSENQRGVVHTASYEARARGIHTGMPLVQAKRTCPEAVFLKGNYQHYKAASLVMQDVYLRYTPLVEFTSLDDAYLDFTGALHLYTSPADIGRDIQRDILDALHISVSVGAGSNKVIARMASGQKKPGGITTVPAGREKEFLAPLPVDELPGVGHVAKEKLVELGIFTIGQLAALPKILLSEIFGVNGQKMWELANGLDAREVKTRIVPRQISRETTFEEDTTDQAVVLSCLQYLAERIAAKLREQELVGRRIGLKIRYSDFTQYQSSHTLTQETDSAGDIFGGVRDIFLRLPLRRLRIRHAGIWVTNIEWRNLQLQLFSQESRTELLDAAVDEIRDKFGFMAILPADTLELRRKYRIEKNGYVLHSPALTR
jgi:DNA polymerase-4